MLTYDLEKNGAEPKYIYLFKCIRQDIIDGKLKKGEKLPSKRALASHLSIGVITVANAYAQLETEGYILAEEKRGYFVQDISSFGAGMKLSVKRAEERKTVLHADSDGKEREFFVDFKANRTGLEHFPASRWNHYMREALSMSDDSLLKTVPYKGLYRLRVAISDYLYRERGINADPSQIVIGAGTEYLYSRLIQMFGRACTFASEDPGYKKFSVIAKSYGNPWIYVPIDMKGLRVDLLEEYGADVVHVSPANHFPTGIVMPVTRRAELLEWANRVKKRYIIEDDYDCEFRYSGQLILPLFAEDSNSKVIYINTFSKTLVPSLRVSYMVLPQELMKRYEQTMSFYSCTVSSFEQYALSRFIEEREFERHINRMRNYYRQQRSVILDAFGASGLADISTIHENNAGTHFLLQVKTGMTQAEVIEKAHSYDMHLSLYSDFCSNDRLKENEYVYAGENSVTLVINYAGVDRGNVADIVKRMCLVFGCDG